MRQVRTCHVRYQRGNGECREEERSRPSGKVNRLIAVVSEIADDKLQVGEGQRSEEGARAFGNVGAELVGGAHSLARDATRSSLGAFPLRSMKQH